MKRTETVLSAFTAHRVAASSIPVVETDRDPLTDEQIEALAQTERPLSPLYLAACDLLSAIKAEEPYFQQIARENQRADWEDHEVNADKGLTTEINRSTSLVRIADTVDNCFALLKRHPFGFKNGSRNVRGQVVVKPYTESENLAAEQWAECIKSGSRPVVAEDNED